MVWTPNGLLRLRSRSRKGVCAATAQAAVEEDALHIKVDTYGEWANEFIRCKTFVGHSIVPNRAYAITIGAQSQNPSIKLVPPTVDSRLRESAFVQENQRYKRTSSHSYGSEIHICACKRKDANTAQLFVKNTGVAHAVVRNVSARYDERFQRRSELILSVRSSSFDRFVVIYFHQIGEGWLQHLFARFLLPWPAN